MALCVTIARRRFCNSVLDFKTFLKSKKFANDISFNHLHKSKDFAKSTLRYDSIFKKVNYSQKQFLTNLLVNRQEILSKNWQDFSISTKLFVLDSFIIIKGTGEQSTLLYSDDFFSNINNYIKELDIYELIQVIYLCRVLNHNDNSLINALTNAIEHRLTNFSNLSSMDAVVLCDSLFRLKFKMKTNFLLNNIANFVANDILSGKLSNSSVLSIIKFVRMNNYQNSVLLDSVKQFVSRQLKCFNFTLSTHFLAFFANFSYFDTHLLESFEKHSILLLENSRTQNKAVRSKDICKILWSFAHLNYKLSSPLQKLIIWWLNELSQEFILYPHHMIDSLKSLCLMGIYEVDFFERTLNSIELLEKLNNSERDKTPRDLHFVLESIAIECPTIQLKRRYLLASGSEEINKNIEDDRKKRPLLDLFLEKLEKSFNATVKFDYVLKHFPIASIVADDFSIEIIDSTTKMNNCDRLNGLMTAKLRQMKILDINFQLVKTEDDLKKLDFV